jgi:hypothetical protein
MGCQLRVKLNLYAEMPLHFPEVPGYWLLARYMEAISLQFSIIANSRFADKRRIPALTI